MMRRRIAVTAAVLLLWVAPARAEFEVGYEAFQQGDYESAAELLRPVAERGDARAQYMLGVILENGLTGTIDTATAAGWYRRAAEQDYIQAQVELARLYREGDGVDQDYAKMATWYRRAAELGDVGAQLYLADTFAYGYGVERDLVQAYVWYEIAMRYWGSLAAEARNMVAEEMSPAEIAEAEGLVAKWVSANGNRE